MRDIKRILCPVDFSDVSSHTADHAVLMARWYEAKITALHVSNPIVIPIADYAVVAVAPSPVLTADDLGEARTRVQECFAAAKAPDVDVTSKSDSPRTGFCNAPEPRPRT